MSNSLRECCHLGQTLLISTLVISWVEGYHYTQTYLQFLI